MQSYREEKDAVGIKKVPAEAYYGVQSLRAAENFKITGEKVHPEMIRAMAEIKKAAAQANRNAKVLDAKTANAIIKASEEIREGNFYEAFITDAIQGGAGTSLNMNANEVIANRAIEILGGEKGNYTIVHPNDHVNCGQSTNDVYPSAGKIATIRLVKRTVKKLEKLQAAFVEKAGTYGHIIKMGRTEMQDAVPVSFRQVFGAYASAIERDIKRFGIAEGELASLNLGGTAVGTGLNANKAYRETVVPILAEITGLPLVKASDLADATQNLDVFVFVSGIIKSLAVTLSKIANDLRLMSSGPRTGFGELALPPKQNGSSIMPGKINPVIPEVMNEICFLVMGNDVTITHAAEAGQLELNAFEPIVFRCLFESLETIGNGVEIFCKDCISGLRVCEERCREQLENSVGMVTALCPSIGYERAASFAKKALSEGKKLREVVRAEKIMTEKEIASLLDPEKMI